MSEEGTSRASSNQENASQENTYQQKTMGAAASVSAIILAGGQSRRMGQDKALLSTRDGQSLLLRTVKTVRQLTSSVLIVTPWPERYRHQLLSAIVPEQVPLVQFVREQLSNPAHGPLGGFVQGWEQVSSEWCLLLACDLPYLEGPVLQAWWDELRVVNGTPPMASLVPGKKGWEPLCGFYHRNCLPELRRYLRDGGRSFQGWLASVPVRPYEHVPTQMLFNCNTPQDWSTVSF